MRTVFSPSLAARALTACVVLGLPAIASAQLRVVDLSISAEEHAELVDGEILVDVDVNGRIAEARVIGVVDRPVDEVWRVVADFENQDQWVPDAYDTVIVGREGDAIIGDGMTSVPFPLTDRQWRIRIRHHEEERDGQPRYVAEWVHVPDVGNMNANDGYWLLQPFDGDDSRTLVTYAVRVDSGISVPDAIERSATRRMFPDFIRRLRERVGRN